MNDKLRNSLWNAVTEFYLYEAYGILCKNGSTYSLYKEIYADFFKAPFDTIPSRVNEARRVVREAFFGLEWNNVYDFIEFLSTNNFLLAFSTDRFMKKCNKILEREFSAYRFVSGKITSITSHHEIKEIEQASEEENNGMILQTERCF